MNTEIICHKPFDNKTFASYEVIDFTNLPDDYATQWRGGRSSFWMTMTKKETKTFERWVGVLLGKGIMCMIDIDTKEKYAYVNAKGNEKRMVADEFVRLYGGVLYFDGEKVEKDGETE